ncbi:MAG: VanZ family protein [Acidimicrobiales bacterium]
MVILHAGAVLWTATIVWVLWRLLLWRRHPPLRPAREGVVTLLFVWALIVVKVTMFPLTIIFYDWHESSNFTPFASIVEILRSTSPWFALENIGGNVVMFIPFGFLMPVLFEKVRHPWAILWRAAAVSVLIESAQYVTRARAVDVDDVILNTTGALVGYGIFAVVSRYGRRFAVRQPAFGSGVDSTPREPLLAAAAPLVVTVVIAVPMLLSTIVAETLDGGPDGIEAVATADLDAAEIIARADIGSHTFLVASGDMASGPRLVFAEFVKVLPGRYSWLGTSTVEPGSGSEYHFSSRRSTRAARSGRS